MPGQMRAAAGTYLQKKSLFTWCVAHTLPTKEKEVFLILDFIAPAFLTQIRATLGAPSHLQDSNQKLCARSLNLLTFP